MEKAPACRQMFQHDRLSFSRLHSSTSLPPLLCVCKAFIKRFMQKFFQGGGAEPTCRVSHCDRFQQIFFFVCYRGTQDVSTLKPPFLNSLLDRLSSLDVTLITCEFMPTDWLRESASERMRTCTCACAHVSRVPLVANVLDTALPAGKLAYAYQSEWQNCRTQQLRGKYIV